uniref:G_PROTEIN_RECEP_F1_2 domain-containing protein n=1 Tax=Parastrongyloides trichosuri TaxID=131310 RepID=A0A0N4ZCB5_PARTI
MQLFALDPVIDFTIHNISLLPSDQCATEDQRAAKCCCGTGFIFDFTTKKCLISENVSFMFGELNNSWSHLVIYGFVYPMLVVTMIAPLSAVMLGMGKREKKEGDKRFPNPLYQMIWLLSFCGWVSLLAPLPFSLWYYIVGDGIRSPNQSLLMCHLYRYTLQSIPHAIDTMMILFSILLTAARFLTQYHRNNLKLRTVERFARIIWTIIFCGIMIGILHHLEHDVAVYPFCLDAEEGPTWVHRCMIRDGSLYNFMGRRFWKITLPIAVLIVQFIIPGIMLFLIHLGFAREPVIDASHCHNRFGRTPRDQTKILITTVTISFALAEIPTLIVTLFSLWVNQGISENKLVIYMGRFIGHLQPTFGAITIVANCGALLTAYYIIVKDEDDDVGDSEADFSSCDSTEDKLLRLNDNRRNTKCFLTVSHSFDTSSMQSSSRRGSAMPEDYILTIGSTPSPALRPTPIML